jgi:hypothetical protein
MTSTFSANLEYWPLDRLIPHARNARTHSEAQVAQIAGSIAEFSFVNPVLVGDDGVIVAGHGRVLAARKLGLSEAPVIVLAHLSPTQRRALMMPTIELLRMQAGTMNCWRPNWLRSAMRTSSSDCLVSTRLNWIACSTARRKRMKTPTRLPMRQQLDPSERIAPIVARKCQVAAGCISPDPTQCKQALADLLTVMDQMSGKSS